MRVLTCALGLLCIGSNKCQIHSTLLLLSLLIMIKWHQEVHIKKSLLASGGFKWHQEVQLLTHFLYFLKMAPKSYPLGKNFDFWVFWLKAATVWTAMLSRVQQSKNHTDRLRLTPQIKVPTEPKLADYSGICGNLWYKCN